MVKLNVFTSVDFSVHNRLELLLWPGSTFRFFADREALAKRVCEHRTTVGCKEHGGYHYDAVIEASKVGQGVDECIPVAFLLYTYFTESDVDLLVLKDLKFCFIGDRVYFVQFVGILTSRFH